MLAFPPSQLEFIANQLVEGFLIGLNKSPFHGFSVEFAEHRLYNSGESTRHIDWKLYARSEKLFTKKYEEEKEPAFKKYLEVREPAYKKYLEVEQPAGKKYEEEIRKIDAMGIKKCEVCGK
jgi:hypothetical protein